MSHIPVNFAVSHQTRAGKCSSVNSVFGWSDFLGVAASVGCAIHCAALPFFLSALPAWGLAWLVHESAHKWMFLICLLIAVTAFVPSLIRHRNVSPLALGSVGLACIGIGAFSSSSCSCEGCSRCGPIAESPIFVSSGIAEESTTKFRKVLSRNESAPTSSAALVAVMDSDSSASFLATNRPAEASEYCWAPLMMWITPIGGTLLVFAHLLNHHFGNLCRC
jgi:hypothetical protein